MKDACAIHYAGSSRLVDIMDDPVFGRAGAFLFPEGWHHIDGTWTLDDVPRLLPYHSHVDINTTVSVLEYLHDKASRRTIFYDIYSAGEKAADRSKEDTGLFFFKGDEGAPFAVVSAGGGFSYVGSIHESFPHALVISCHGANAFALQYRTGSAQWAVEDLARAIDFIMEHADDLGVSRNHYSVWGGSAGARMAAYIGSYTPAAFGARTAARPYSVIMQYTGHDDYTADDPATYACVGDRDGIAPWRVMKRRIDAMDRLGIATEFHLYKGLGHGFGLGLGTSAEAWIEDAIAFWKGTMTSQEV